MTDNKRFKITDYSDEFIKNAIISYITYTEQNRERQRRYQAKHGKERGLIRAKKYYYKVKKNNQYHPEYNPEGIKKINKIKKIKKTKSN